MVEPASNPGTAPQAPAQAKPQQAQIQVDDSKAIPMYTNFCRVTGTPEEMIIDFGLNPQPVDVSTFSIVITQRIVTNYFTAKRMLHALMMTIQRHEATFGVIETDIQRRVHPSAMQQAAQ
ncbi:MAG: DUF3467 domain-containing protein [Thermoguttaceae bacterium]|jgi:hypothetical protein